MKEIEKRFFIIRLNGSEKDGQAKMMSETITDWIYEERN
tara:strand:+ start:89 stop:205 length:117 start_codon:yes stop_codon:yes gene_type:complete